jgi:chaperonin GroES
MDKLPQPIYDRILLKVNNEDEISEGGIILPQTPDQDEDILRGEVLRVGDGRRSEAGMLIPMTVMPGMIVAFDGENASTIKISGKEYFLLDEASVLAILP